MNYSEQKETTKVFKNQYVRGLETLISKRKAEYEKERENCFQEIIRQSDSYRIQLREILGWPLIGRAQKGVLSVNYEKLSEEKECTIYRLHFEVLEDVVLTGLFFYRDKRKPLVIAQHGKLGTPEAAAEFYGNSSNYNRMIHRILPYDVNVFAPQLLLWNEETYDSMYNRQDIDAQLRSLGSSVAAVELFGLMKILDYFEEQDFRKSFGMIGLSYGGFYTLFMAALDKRIKAAISCSYFNSRENHTFQDWHWFDMSKKFEDAEIASLIYPRKLCIQVGISDPVFQAEGAVHEEKRLKKICGELGTDWYQFMLFDGVHEFCKDDEPIKELIEQLYK